MKKIIPIRAGVAIPAQRTILDYEQQAAIASYAYSSDVSDSNSTYAGVYEIDGVGTSATSGECSGRYNLKRLKENRVVTFDTMPLFALSLLKKHKWLRSSRQNRYNFVQLDGAQDLDPIQAELMQMLTAMAGNLYVCRDSRQEIYSFRGSYGFFFKAFLVRS